MDNQHAAELYRCLTDLDVEGMRRLHHHLWPHFPQPETREDCLISMHMARLQLHRIHPDAKEYSRKWLDERPGRKVACAVGVAVLSKSRSSTPTRASNVAAAMTYSVYDSIKAGLDIDAEASEVFKRMMIARERERGGRPMIGWTLEQPKVTVTYGEGNGSCSS